MQIKSKVLKNAEGKVIGIGLVPDGESWGEKFCGFFAKAFKVKDAEVRIEHDFVVFDIKSLNNQFVVRPESEDLQSLQENVFSGAQELAIEPFSDPDDPTNPSNSGFKIVVKE